MRKKKFILFLSFEAAIELFVLKIKKKEKLYSIVLRQKNEKNKRDVENQWKVHIAKQNKIECALCN